MNLAMDKNGKVIYTSQISNVDLARKNQWRCVKCKQKVVLKANKYGSTYFSHLTKCADEYGEVKQSETEDHKLAKDMLYKVLKASYEFVACEHYLSNIRQTPDIYIQKNNNEAFVIEIQHSTTSFSEIFNRTTAYHSKGIKVFWLIDKIQFKQNKLTVWQQTMLQFSQSLGIYCIFIDVYRKEILIKSQLPAIYQPSRLKYIEYSFAINESIHYLFEDQLSEINHKKTWVSSSYKDYPLDYQRSLISIQRNRHYFKDLQYLYQQGFIIRHLPTWVLTEKWEVLFIQKPFWFIFACLQLKLLKDKKNLLKTESVLKTIETGLDEEFFQHRSIALIGNDFTKDLTKAFFNLFIVKDFIIKVSDNLWKVSL